MTGDTGLGLLFREPLPEPEGAGEPAAPAVHGRGLRSRWRQSRTLTAVVVVVLLLGAGIGIWAATGSSAATYRWATVTKADVDQTLNSYGTVTPIHQANVTFPVSGTVATVPVTIGQQVKAGQTLATLQTSSLQSKLDAAKSALATAQAKLVSDEAAQASGSTVAATNTSATLSGADTGQATPLATPPPSTFPSKSAGGTGGSGRTGATGGSGTTSTAQAAVTQAQQALLAAQKQLDADTSAIANALHYCAPLFASLPAPGPTPSLSPAASPSSAGSGPQQSPDTSNCTSMLAALPSQQQLAADQSTVSTDETALTTAVNNLAAQAKSATSSNGSGSTGGSGGSSNTRGSSGSTGASSASGGSGRGSGAGGTTVTAEQLVVDQATVDADAANAIVAAEALNQAKLVSPLAGTVAAISISPGSTAGTSSAAVTVIGPGADQVSTTITDLDLKEVHIGSDASVIPDGSNTPVHGTVTAIGLLPVSSTSSSSSSSSGRSGSGSSSNGSSSASSTSSSASYPVTISLDAGGLYSGSGADVSIVVKKVSNVLAVPTSAITSLGALHTVTVQSGGKAKRQVVQVGASDAIHTQVTSGLTQGEHVALAQVNAAVPSSGSNTNLARLAGGGGFGGFNRNGAGGTGRTGRTGAVLVPKAGG